MYYKIMFFHKRILVANDFSDCSKVALSIGMQASKCMKTKMFVLHTIEKLPHDYMHIFPRAAHINIKQRSEQEAFDRLNSMLPKDLVDNETIVPIVRTGRPFLEIVQAAKENDVDIILIGTHGRAGIDRVFLGSVAERVVRKSYCPVMVVRNSEYAGFKQIVVPVDFSDCSKMALECAISTARAHKSALTVVHVFEESFIEPYVRAANSEKEADEIVRKVEYVNVSKFEDFLNKFDLSGIVFKKLLKKGIPEKNISEIALEQKAQLIIMGTHGRSGIKHMLVGSTAEEVVRTVHCDIIVVKPESMIHRAVGLDKVIGNR